MRRQRILLSLALAAFAGILLACSGASAPKPGAIAKASDSKKESRAEDSMPPTPRKKRPPKTEEGPRFVREKLAELDGFKGQASFHGYGFGLGGPHHAWLQAVEKERALDRFSLPERVALGDVMELGFEYMRTKGEENKLTRFLREEVTRSLAADPN